MAATQAGMKRFYILFAVMAVAGLGVAGLPSHPARHGEHSRQRDGSGIRHLRVSRATSKDRPPRRSRSPNTPTTSAPSARPLPRSRCRLSRSGSSTPAGSAGATAIFPCSSTPLPGWRRIRPPAPTSRESTGSSTGRIYEGQSEWSASRNAAPIFRKYARAGGVDLGRYDACMKAGKYAGPDPGRLELGTRARA